MLPNELIRVLAWSEGSEPRDVYGDGIRDAIADHLRALPDMVVRTESLNHPGQGVWPDDLARADVLIWWSHACHDELADEAAERIARRVSEDGMGFVALHSSNRSKPLRRLLGASGALGGTRADGGPEEVRVLLPDHPITAGVRDFTIGREELYREPFDVPEPDERVFASYFPEHDTTFGCGGCCWTRGTGRIFYFRPGHETYPTYLDKNVLRVLTNAVRWAARRV